MSGPPEGIGMLGPVLKGGRVLFSPHKGAFHLTHSLSFTFQSSKFRNHFITSSKYREFSPYANFITAVFLNYYYNFANAILWAIYFVSVFIS